ncbi:MAG: FimV/HubP family polar landmark protein, partial [Burkholderiaceae bacterium]
PVAAAKPSPVQAAKQPAATPSAAAASKNSGEQVKVTGGDTAGKIAANNRPANVSLDQMLIAMLRGNPDAFIGNNINRLKAGAILSLPTSEEAQAMPDSAARQAVLAQSKDFNDFRRKLAENAPGIASKAPDRQAGGKVEAKVEDRKTAAVTPDKLTLSKGSLTTDPKAAASKDTKDNSEKIAKERQAKDDAARVAELSKNITDLNKIAGAAPAATVKPAAGNAPAAPASPAVAATAPTAAGKAAGAVALTAPTAVVAATTPSTAAPAATNAAPAASTPATPAATGTPAAATPAPATTTATPAAAATPPTTPTVPATPVVVVKVPVPEPSFLDGLMGNPAVLPAAGGLLALLAAGGLYLARKRKNRVEEEDDELGTEFEEQSFFNTTNHAADIHNELSIDPVAIDARTTTVEPTMPVAAETPVALAPMPMPVPVPVPVPELSTLPVVLAAAPLTATTKVEDEFPDFTPSEFSERTIAQLDPESAKSPASVDLDLDFDFASDFPAAAPSPSPVIAVVKPAAAPVAAVDDHSLDFDMPSLSTIGAGAAVAAAAATAAYAPHAAATPAAAPTKAPAANHVAPLDFNMDSLSLDLNANNQQTGATAANAIGPLETKLALAQEFRAIGDATGAKMLAQEVIALASGSLKIKAETLLAEIG